MSAAEPAANMPGNMPREVVEVPSILLPCHHLTERPERRAATVACYCGKIWQLELGSGGHHWNAWSLST